jgi:hypothetical protein
MLSSFPKRTLLLGGSAILLALMLVIRWLSDWGLVTIHVKDAPLETVISSIARQGHVRIETSLDPSMKVSMDADQVTATEAVEQLAEATDSSWRGAIITAPSKPALTEAVSLLRAGSSPEGWRVFYYPLSPMMTPEYSAVDPRSLVWNVQGPDREAVKLLDEAAQKSGAMIVAPKDWNPMAPRLPVSAATGKAVHDLAVSVRGRDLSFYYLTARERRRWGDGTSADRTMEGSQTLANPPASKTEWVDQRIRATINALPVTKQTEAKKEYEESKAFRESIKNLTPEERRQKMRERMADPAFAEKMGDRMLLRDSRRTAQQRISRAVNYLNRKASLQGSQPHGP